MNTDMDQGIERGIEQGVEQGIQRGNREVIRRQLERRFGPLPEWATQKLAAADPAKLEDWALQLLDATSLESILR